MTTHTERSPRCANTEGTRAETPTKKEFVMQQFIPSNPSVSVDLFKAEDWAKVPVQVDGEEWAKSVDLRINVGAGEYLIVGLQSNDDQPVPVMDIPAIVEMTPTDVRALASGLEHVAALMDQITLAAEGVER